MESSHVNGTSGNVKSTTEDQKEVPDIETVSNLSDLSGFNFKRVLCDNQETKSIFIEGSFQDKVGAAILILEKDPFQVNTLTNLFRDESQQEKIFQNDIYYNFRYLPTSFFNGIKINVIHPATEKHFKKYEFQPVHIINESYDDYKSITLPVLKEEQFSIQWVYNILEHKSEAERILFEDSDPEIGFILLPDLKWDGKTVESLYLLALPQKKNILSLRDLTAAHLPLLKNIYEQGLKTIQDKYSISTSQLRVYIHYQPTFYHFHIHFTYLQYAAPGTSTERSHLLSSVINNIELMSNYYQKAILPFTVKETDSLFTAYEAQGKVKRVLKSV